MFFLWSYFYFFIIIQIENVVIFKGVYKNTLYFNFKLYLINIIIFFTLINYFSLVLITLITFEFLNYTINQNIKNPIRVNLNYLNKFVFESYLFFKIQLNIHDIFIFWFYIQFIKVSRLTKKIIIMLNAFIFITKYLNYRFNNIIEFQIIFLFILF